MRTILKTIQKMRRNRIPGQVVIQITNRCNALCPQCGMRRSAAIQRASLPDATIRRILDACSAKGVQAVSFTGGEPLLMPDRVVEWITYAGRAGIPFIRTGTNGFLFRDPKRPDFEYRIKHLAERLAATPLRNFWISLDSWIPEVHERMRGLPGVVAGIEKALPIFHDFGLYPSANLGISRLVGGVETNDVRAKWHTHRETYLTAFYEAFRNAFDHFYGFVADLGFTTVNTCYPMSIGEQEQADGLNAVYGASVVEDVVRFAHDEKAMLYKALLDTIPLHRHRLRIFSPLSSIYALYREYASPGRTSQGFECRGGIDFFFIDAFEGDTYPCGYRGDENLGKLWDLDVEDLRPGQDCRRCDWECFRDPAELCGPMTEAFTSPRQFARRVTADTTFRRLWLGDLNYYRRCDLFDGRRPLNTNRLKRYSCLQTVNDESRQWVNTDLIRARG